MENQLFGFNLKGIFKHVKVKIKCCCLKFENQKWHHKKVLFNSCYLSSDTFVFHPATQKLEQFLQRNKQYHMKVLLSN